MKTKFVSETNSKCDKQLMNKIPVIELCHLFLKIIANFKRNFPKFIYIKNLIKNVINDKNSRDSLQRSFYLSFIFTLRVDQFQFYFNSQIYFFLIYLLVLLLYFTNLHINILKLSTWLSFFQRLKIKINFLKLNSFYTKLESSNCYNCVFDLE